MKASRHGGAIGLTIGTFAVLIACVANAGCGRPPTLTKNPNDQGSGSKGDPWQSAAKKIQKESDLLTCKSVLNGLNNELSGPEKPTGLSREAIEALAKIVPLNPDDRAEIEGAAFSQHDSVYLADSLFLLDAARSLALPGVPPEKLADLGFAWVGRQVYLNPWLIQTQNDLLPSALPPVNVLRRGSGSALERMYVFLAWLRQAGLDGCLIGHAKAGDVTAYSAKGPDGKPLSGGPARPFWAVGVRIGDDIKLYDPWRGEPFPATWNRLKANPEAYRDWFDSRDNVSGVTLEDVRAANVYLAAPVNALSPRMLMLEEKLKSDVGVKLSVNPAALRDAFPDPKPAFWNPVNDRFAYGRTARTFLPPEHGGSDKTEIGQGRLFDDYIRSQMPPADRIIPAELLFDKAVVGDIKERIARIAGGAFHFAFLTPPTPRERLQRGFFKDASRGLVERQDEFTKSLERVRNSKDADKQMREWAEKATELYRRLGLDRDALAALDEHWRSPAAALQLDRAIGEIGQAEAVYLLALCNHEQAERVQSRLDQATGDTTFLKAEAASAWAAARREWLGYMEQYSSAQAGMPGRAAHARTLSARAERQAGQK